jgi:hypothetical protein
MVSSMEKLVTEFKKQFQPSETDAADHGAADRADAAGDRPANEGENSAPEASGQAADNPADESE